jgi:hypothetical protein
VREQRRRLLAAVSGALFGGIVTGVVAQLVAMPFAELDSWLQYFALWAVAVLLGATLGGPVLKATLDRFDYRISYHAAVVALVSGQAFAVLHVWLHLGAILPYGVVSVVASAAVVWFVARFARARSAAEPL